MESLPTGTVTFLYTDIESSTKRWEAHPVAMKAAVERHDAILRGVIEEHGGTVFRTMGDAFCAVFDLAGDALAGALDAQRTLQKEEWDGEIAPIKVRMALHTGTGEVRDGDYVGTPLNRIARLLNTGYGGQILLSRTAYDLVRDTLPQGVTLQDLGEHRLKDLQRPEHVFQVLATELEGDHPPLKTLDYRPNNLPVERSPLIGREVELAQVTRLLLRDDVGVLTMTGPGGIGKTRLSLQAAAELIDRFQDGVFVVMLAHVTDPALVAQAIVQTLGVKESPGKQAAESLGDYLSDKKMLLVLDNFEQVVEAAPVVAGLLAKASGLKMLVTSREALHVRGEQEYAVPPLGLPDPKQLPSIERMSQYDAVALFIQRARMVKPDFEINNENAPAVAEICHKLDGLPLAIELAAARVRLLPPRALLERLSSRLRLLTGGGRDLPARQQTLRGAIQWSYDLLHAGEQLLFRRMSVFIGGCGLDAIETICNADMALDVDTLDAVASLVDKSLARQEPGGDSEPRIVMLDTIREYGMELLKDDPTDAGGISRRHAEYFAALAEEAAPGIQGPEQSEWLGRMDDERENINGAFQWALATGEAEIALRICGAMINFWQFRGLTNEESTWAESALALPGAQERTAHRATALLSASVIAVRGGDTDQVLALAEESASIWREIGGTKGDRGLGQTLTMLALAYFQTDLEKGKALLYEGVELLRKSATKVEVATSLLDVGIMTASIGDYALVESTYEEALVMFREARDNWGISQVLNALGDLMRISGNYAKARGLYEESLALYRKLDIRPDIPASLHNLGYVALAEGDTARARELFAEALGLQLAQKNRQGVAECIAGLAGVAAALGQGERSARLYGALVAQGYGKGVIMWAAEQVEFERNRAKSRALLDEEDWQEEWMEGRAMMLEQAIAYALAEG